MLVTFTDACITLLTFSHQYRYRIQISGTNLEKRGLIAPLTPNGPQYLSGPGTMYLSYTPHVGPVVRYTVSALEVTVVATSLADVILPDWLASGRKVFLSNSWTVAQPQGQL